VRRFIEGRKVRINGELCLDSARRVQEGESIELLRKPAAPPPTPDVVQLRYLDEHLVVAEKPSGINTVRHPSEREWSFQRRQLSPTLEDLLPPLIAKREGRLRKGPLPRLRVVQRLDKETSGLVVFARTPEAERELGQQFRKHTVIRRYEALVAGHFTSQRLVSRLVRDRGDGRRGSSDEPGAGKEAITHVDVIEQLPGFTLLACRLETGRTHQIRIHLAEQGHPVCGEKVYNRTPGGKVIPDASGVPRLALHAAELGFIHPHTKQGMHWTMPLPDDLRDFLQKLRTAKKQPARPARPPRPRPAEGAED
jgi:23S rRNA pseudouridine1911/1915/1917 synthase